MGYAYLKIREKEMHALHSSASTNNASVSSNKTSTEYFTVGDQKWEAVLHGGRLLYIKREPICNEHGLQFIYVSPYFYCPADDCKNMENNDHAKFMGIAESYIKKDMNFSHLK